MAALGTISIKQQDGTYKKYTINISDETDKFGNNITVFEEQTKEQRDAKVKRNYLANGRIFWNNEVIKNATKKDEETTPF
jgi:hypothetical protein